MRNGLAARACGVEVSGLVGPKDREGRGGEALGGYVDVRAVKGCGGGEEQRLRQGPSLEVGVDGGIEGWHLWIERCRGICLRESSWFGDLLGFDVPWKMSA